MTSLVHPAVVDYLAGLSRLPHPQLDVVAREGRSEGLPLVLPDTGALLHALTRLTGARRVLEIGTAIGYSTLWMATALPTDGLLISLERDAVAGGTRPRTCQGGWSGRAGERDDRRRHALPAQDRRPVRPDLPGRRQGAAI